MAEPEQVAGIVKSLTKAQRADVAHGKCIMEDNTGCLCDSNHLKPLIRAGLVKTSMRAVFLTELGYAVRSALKENDRGQMAPH